MNRYEVLRAMLAKCIFTNKQTNIYIIYIIIYIHTDIIKNIRQLVCSAHYQPTT